MDTRIVESPATPRVIRVHADDNVAIVANDFGLPVGARLPCGLPLRERVPQGHKVAMVDIAMGEPVRRYNVVIGYAAQDLPAGSWVNEQRLVMPAPPALEGLPIATENAPLTPPLEGYSFEGYRNADGSVGTRNLLAITTTVQCVSGVVEHAVRRIRDELLPKYRRGGT
jgi:galactarate dehydratase